MVRENDDIYNVRHLGHVEPFSQVLHTPVQLIRLLKDVKKRVTVYTVILFIKLQASKTQLFIEKGHEINIHWSFVIVCFLR
jgi:hypothetical protein